LDLIRTEVRCDSSLTLYLECSMRKIIYLLMLSAIFVTGCGGGGDDGGTTPPPSNPDAPTLSSIGNKTVTSGDTVSFTVNATDPNGLTLMYDSDGSVGAGFDPYTEIVPSAMFDEPLTPRQFSWSTNGVPLGDYFIAFSVMNSAGFSHGETIRISIQNTPQPQNQFQIGQTLYNADCRGSGCHNDEDNNVPIGTSFTVLCQPESAIKFFTELGPRSMPIFSYTAAQEAAIANYLNNVRPGDC